MEAQRKGFGPSQVLLRSFSGPSRTAPAWVLSRVCSSYWQKINLLQNESFTDPCAQGPEALPSPPSSLTLVSAGLFFTCSFALFSLILVSYRAAQYFDFLLFLFLWLLFWVHNRQICFACEEMLEYIKYFPPSPPHNSIM